MHTRGLLSLNLPPKAAREHHSGMKRQREDSDGREGVEEYDAEVHEEAGLDEEEQVPAKVAQREDGSIVERVPVVCNGLRGDFLVASTRILCRCSTTKS